MLIVSGRHVVALAVLAGLAVAPLAAQEQGLKLAYIDSNQIVREAPGFEQVRQTLRAEAERLKVRRDSLETELNTMAEEYQSQRLVMSAERRREKEQEIRAKQEDLLRFQQQAQQTLGARQEELYGPLYERVSKVINEIGEQEGYDFIFDSGSGALLWGDDAHDLTRRVLVRLQEMGQKGG